MPNFNLKIKTTIMGLFAIVVIFISIIFIYFQNQLTNKLALEKTQNNFNTVVKESVNQIKAYDTSTTEFINLIQNVDSITNDINFSSEHPLLPVIADYMKSAKHIYAIYLGFSNDNFYIVYNLQLADNMKQADGLKGVHWLVKKHIKRDNKIVSLKQFLDQKLNLISQKEETTTYKASLRPWYIQASTSSSIIKTQPYTFSAIAQPGITYAKKIDEKKGIVLAVDITLNSIERIINKQKFVQGSGVFLYDNSGNTIVSRNKIELESSPKDDYFINLFMYKDRVNDLNKQTIIKLENQEYIKYSSKVDSYNGVASYLSFLAPLKEIMNPYRDQAVKSLLVTNVLLIIFIMPLVYFAVQLIVKPIIKLQKENTKIAEGKFDEVNFVDSFMVEISNLSSSFVRMSKSIQEQRQDNDKLINIGYALSSIKDYTVILETILIGAKDIVGADGGTLYLYDRENNALDFKIALNNSLDIHIGGTKSELNWPAINMCDGQGNVNKKNISVVSAVEDRIVMLNDVYHSKDFDFSGVKNFDTTNNYKTQSMLVVPIKDRDGELVAVLQLINKIKENKSVAFNNNDKSLVKSMAELSAMTLHNNRLVADLEKLLYALVESIGAALGEKSTYTGKHVDNVAALSMSMARAINEDDTVFKEVRFSEEELEEIKLAAWLHDIGKITTPEYVVDKATRLETIYDRIHTIEAKIEVAKRDLQIAHLTNQIDTTHMNQRVQQLQEDLSFIKLINSGDHFMTPENKEKLDDIFNRCEVNINNQDMGLITDNEYYNLAIQKGTLTNEERDIINNHVLVSYNMLKKLPFPKRFANVPKLAGSHHKTIDGKGYAHEDIMDLEMTISDKILAVADVFEALAAHDRPYRQPNTLNQIAKILMFMVKDKHLDQDIVRFFLENKVYKNYVDEHFLEDQLDNIDLDFNLIKYKD